jgi:hypothetical protein
LLRYVPDLAVVAHDDGSLAPNDIATIERHIRGVKVIRRLDSDKAVGTILAHFPKVRAYRAQIINSMELTDHALLAQKEKVIIINSDVLFLRQPDEVIQWISSDEGDVLCVYENEPYQQAAFLSRIGSPFPPHLTLGLVCLRKSIVDPSGIEEILNQVEPSDDPWYIGQNSLPALIAKKVDIGKIRFLDPTYYEASGAFTENAIFRHYWSSLASLNSQYFSDAARVIAELQSADGRGVD